MTKPKAKPQENPERNARIAQVLDMVDKGEVTAEIMFQTGYSNIRVMQILRANGREPNLPATWWTKERTDELIRLHGDGLSRSAIARVLKTTRNAVCGKAFQLGLTKRAIPAAFSSTTEVSPAQMKQVEDMIKAGNGRRKIAKFLGVSVSRAKNVVAKIQRGPGAHNAKRLTDADVATIRRMMEEGKGNNAIVIAFGIGKERAERLRAGFGIPAFAHEQPVPALKPVQAITPAAEYVPMPTGPRMPLPAGSPESWGPISLGMEWPGA